MLINIMIQTCEDCFDIEFSLSARLQVGRDGSEVFYSQERTLGLEEFAH